MQGAKAAAKKRVGGEILEGSLALELEPDARSHSFEQRVSFGPAQLASEGPVPMVDEPAPLCFVQLVQPYERELGEGAFRNRAGSARDDDLSAGKSLRPGLDRGQRRLARCPGRHLVDAIEQEQRGPYGRGSPTVGWLFDGSEDQLGQRVQVDRLSGTAKRDEKRTPCSRAAFAEALAQQLARIRRSSACPAKAACASSRPARLVWRRSSSARNTGSQVSRSGAMASGSSVLPSRRYCAAWIAAQRSSVLLPAPAGPSIRMRLPSSGIRVRSVAKSACRVSPRMPSLVRNGR